MAKPRILVVDDDIVLCELIREALELEGILVDEAHHVVEADRLLLEHIPDAIVLDIGLPGIDGLFYTTRLRENPATRRLPIIAISGSDVERRLGGRCRRDGIRPEAVRPARAADAARALDRRHAAHARVRPDVDEARTDRAPPARRHRPPPPRASSRGYRETLAAIAGSLEIRGLDTSAHTRRVTAYAMRLTVEVAPALSDDPGLEWGFMFHDIGNIGVPDRILLKRGSLRNDEWKILQQHTVIGEQLLAHVPLLEGEGAPRRALPPRALGRERLSRRPRRPGHPARGSHLRGRRRARRDDRPAPLPPPAALGGRARADPQGAPAASSTRTWSTASSPASPT